jgi:hypothetical protein
MILSANALSEHRQSRIYNPTTASEPTGFSQSSHRLLILGRYDRIRLKSRLCHSDPTPESLIVLDLVVCNRFDRET